MMCERMGIEGYDLFDEAAREFAGRFGDKDDADNYLTRLNFCP